MSKRSMGVVLAAAVVAASLSGCAGSASGETAAPPTSPASPPTIPPRSTTPPASPPPASSPPPTAPAPSYDVSWDAPTAIREGLGAPDTPPPGANQWSCLLTALHPNPIVLVHGTFGNQNDDFQALAPYLANAGYCVYSFTFGQTSYSGGLGAIGDIAASANQLAAFVGDVLARTGAKSVVFVGHSQGGMLPRYYDKFTGGIPFTKQIVALAPSNHATSLEGIALFATIFPGAGPLVGALCPACSEQITPSWYDDGVDAGEETEPSIQYTTIVTTHDEIVTPYTQGFLPAGPNVINLKVQDVCPDDPVGHIGLAYDSGVAQMVVNALTPSQAKPVPCASGWTL